MCDCAGGPTAVTDWSGGDVVCSACGVVLESHILDDCPEWRNYEAGEDKSRVGASSSRGGGGTFLDPVPGCKRARVYREAAEAREAALREGLAAVDHFVGSCRLSSTGSVAAVARELFEDVHAARAVRSDNRRVVAAAAVYHACKMERLGRELRWVAAVCEVDQRALNAATADFKDLLAGRPYHARLFDALPAGTLLDIFLDRLGLAPDPRKRVWRAAHRIDEALAGGAMDCGRKPRTICSGIIGVALAREGVAVGKKELTRACSVCQQTLDKVMAQIRRALADVE